jgi:hypothetical protein
MHRYQKPDYQALRYHSAPKKKKTVGSLDEIDPEMRAAWEKLGIPIGEQVLAAAHGGWLRGSGVRQPIHTLYRLCWMRPCIGVQP